MSEQVEAFIRLVQAYEGSDKEELTSLAKDTLGLTQSRKVLHCPTLAVRFSAVTGSGGSFSNTVLALSVLKKYDDRPFVVCVVRPDRVDLLLANSSFLKKISHSSKELRIDKVRGSFNGSDILREHEGLQNFPENFDELFSRHQAISWSDNLERLVAETQGIVPRIARQVFTEEETTRVLEGPETAHALSTNAEYLAFGASLAAAVERQRAEILGLARIDNVNERGNRIEQAITNAGNYHDLEDVQRQLASGQLVKVDIKSKIMTKSSNPAAYNVDKYLRLLSRGNTALSFFLVGISPDQGRIDTRLVSVLDRGFIRATDIRHHWAGRGSRGATQLSRNVAALFGPGAKEEVHLETARTFLKGLLRAD